MITDSYESKNKYIKYLRILLRDWEDLEIFTPHIYLFE